MSSRRTFSQSSQIRKVRVIVFLQISERIILLKEKNPSGFPLIHNMSDFNFEPCYDFMNFQLHFQI